MMPQNKAACCSLFLAFARECVVKYCTAPMLPPAPQPHKPKLLEQVRQSIRFKHYSLRTEQIYVDWIRRFILFHGKRHPDEMGAEEIREIGRASCRERG